MEFKPSKYFIFGDEIIFHPRADLIFIGNLFLSIFGGMYIIAALFVDDFFSDGFGLFFFLIFPLPFIILFIVTRIFGSQRVIFNKEQQTVLCKSIFGQKLHTSFDEISHIGTTRQLTRDITSYYLQLKSDPYGKGILLINEREAVCRKPIFRLKEMLPNIADEKDMNGRTLEHLRMFRNNGDATYTFKYFDSSSFIIILLSSTAITILALITAWFWLFWLLIIPFAMIFRRSKVTIDHNNGMISTSKWWGLENESFSYSYISDFSCVEYMNGEHQQMSASILAEITPGNYVEIVRRMMRFDKSAILLEDLVLLLNEDPY